MRRHFAGWSLSLFGISIIFWLALTLFESAFVGTSLAIQRVITFLFLVLPTATGAILGMMSLVRKERRPSLAITGILLNTLFALFHILLLLFAG